MCTFDVLVCVHPVREWLVMCSVWTVKSHLARFALEVLCGEGLGFQKARHTHLQGCKT